MTATFIIDALPESARAHRTTHAIVAVDAFRATTTIVTALAAGRRVYPVSSVEEAHLIANGLATPLLAGELGGQRPDQFEFNNSPAALAEAGDRRPLILLSSAGTLLLAIAAGGISTYVACFRNLTATAQYIAARHDRVAIIGAGTRGQRRMEDQMACAWIGARLMAADMSPEDSSTASEVAYWRDVPISAIEASPSADYLRDSGQHDDIEFVLSHVDDLDLVVAFDGVEAKVVQPSLAGQEIGA